MTNLEALKILQHTRRRALDIEQALDLFELQQTEEANMAVRQDVADVITAVDAATDRIATRITNLVAASTTLSADEKAALQAEVVKLNLIGEDPNNVVPTGV